MIPIFVEVSRRYKVDALRVISFLYVVFLLLHILAVNKEVEFLRNIYLYLDNYATHFTGSSCLILALISIFTNGSRTKVFFKKILSVFQNEVSNLPVNNYSKIVSSESEVIIELQEFSKDAEDLYIFSGSADFLNQGSLATNNEYKELAKKGSQCRILISKNFKAKIENLWALQNAGVEVRTYPNDNLYLRGRLKRNDNGNSSLLYNKNNDRFIQQQIDSKYVSNVLLNQYEELFSKGKNPFIKKILIGNRHVWCDKSGSDYVLNTEVSNLAKDLRLKGYDVVVHSDCDVSLANILKKQDVFEDFEIFLSKERSLPGKEHQSFYTNMLSTLRCFSYECVFIDDRSKNLIEAKNNGMYTIKVPPYSDSKHEFIINGLKKLSVLV